MVPVRKRCLPAEPDTSPRLKRDFIAGHRRLSPGLGDETQRSRRASAGLAFCHDLKDR